MKTRCYPLILAGVLFCLNHLAAADAPLAFDASLPAPVPQVRPPAAHLNMARPAIATPQPVGGPLPAGILAFDSETKEYTTKSGEIIAPYVFNLTNISSAEVAITYVQPSCGCTAVQLPPMPWKIPAGGTGQIPVNMNVQGKSGDVVKVITVHTDKGQKPLMVKATIPQPQAQAMTALDRERNQLLAKADRQAIFKGDCATCHLQPVIGKVGKELYASACGVCHEAEHRATMVPDLRNLPNDTDADYWKLMVTLGKPNTLMAAFAQSQGGPLSDMQINSLVEYLVATMPAKGTNSRTAAIQSKEQLRPAAGH
jgi:mono/diheme cytochrome c family protein